MLLAGIFETPVKVGKVIGFLAVVAIAVIECAVAVADPVPHKLRVASFISPLSPQNAEVLQPWINKLEKLSGGDLSIDFFPGGTLGRHGNYQLKLLRDGVQDISLIVPGYTPGRFPDNDLFELPMLMDNTLEASLTYHRMITGGHLRGYDDTKLISVFMSQPYFLHLSNVYATIDDLRGKKIRVAGYLQAEIARRLGATPIGGIPVTQIRESISRGLIDGTILGWDSMHIFGIKYVTSYHIEVPVTYAPILILMNLESYDALPASQKALIDQHSGEKMARDFSKATSALAVKTYNESKAKAGQHFVTPDESDMAHWQRALAPLEEEWISGNSMGEERMDAFKRILAGVRNELDAETKP